MVINKENMRKFEDMSTLEKNLEIAKMLNILYGPEENKVRYNFLDSRGEHIETLKFHCDYSWMMEVVEFIENKVGNPVHIVQGQVSISTKYIQSSREPIIKTSFWRMASKEFNYNGKKQALFFAITQFAIKFNNKEINLD